MNSLYNSLASNNSLLEAEIFTKASMVAISHSVEKVVKKYNLKADIYALFQDYRYFLEERDRYLELDKLSRQIFIFAKNIPEDAGLAFARTTFVELKADSPLLKEWAVTVIHPHYSALLATKEEKEQQKINKEDYRMFKGFLTLDNQIAVESALFYQKILKQKKIALLEDGWELAQLANQKPKLEELISLFVNDSLFELETKLRALEEKEISLNKMAVNNQELSREIMQKLCEAAEFRDEDSIFHILRIGFTAAIIYRELGASKLDIENIFFAALLHDIGKIGIPDSILQKPGKLTAEEYKIMQNHPEMGAKILAGSKTDVLNMAYQIAYFHHEKWDGSGYPQGLKGEEIPLEARIVALADVFDALASKRVYKKAFSREKCIDIVEAERNKHFQAKILDILLNKLDEIYTFRKDLREFAESKTTREISDYFFSIDFSIFEFLKMRKMIN
ncbi:MAG: HD domain-containing phosphohydrolase [Bacillota bacterium]